MSVSVGSLSLSVGEVRIFKDNKLNGDFQSIFVSDYVLNSPQRLLSLNNEATYVAWNLPVGTVVTLLDSTDSVDDPSKNYHCSSRTFDCVGHGTTEAYDLGQCEMNDTISAFYIHQYDPLYGYIELFLRENQKGPSTKIFLSQYGRDKSHSINSWWITNDAISISWSNMGELCCVIFYDNADGTGKKVNEIMGTDTRLGINNLDDYDMRNAISSFKWTIRGIFKQEMSPFTLDIDSSDSQKKLYRATVEGTNAFPKPMKELVKLDSIKETSSTITSAYEYGNGFSMELQGSYTAGPAKATLSVGVDVQVLNSSEKESSTTTTRTIEQSYEVNIPEKSKYKITLTLIVDQVTEKQFTQTCTRWYEFKVKNSKEDVIDGKTYFRRDEPVRGSFRGDAKYTLVPEVEVTPIA